jgi:hypothetical protein
MSHLKPSHLDQPLKMSHAPKRPRIGERTMLACIGCKQKKLKVPKLRPGESHATYHVTSAMGKHRNATIAYGLDEVSLLV